MSNQTPKGLIPAVIGGAVVLIAALGWLMFMLLSGNLDSGSGNGGTTAASGNPGDFGSAVDSGARIDIEQMRIQIEDLQKRLSTVEQEVMLLKSSGSGNPQAAVDPTDPNYLPERLGHFGLCG